MSVTQEQIRAVLERLALPDGGTLVSRDMLRALRIEGSKVSFVIEAPSPEIAKLMEPLRKAAEAAVQSLEGVETVSAALTA
ncbi:iron-sulfur cluster assembly protein, partial [Leisingera sp. ANG-DT]